MSKYDSHLGDSNYVNFIKLLWKLHQTENESQEAEVIRDEMDVYYRKLDNDQIQLVGHISAIFYLIDINALKTSEAGLPPEMEGYFYLNDEDRKRIEKVING